MVLNGCKLDSMQIICFENTLSLLFWRRPIALLFVMVMVMLVVFVIWLVLLNNFVIEVVKFDGVDIGWLYSVCEILGFFVIGVIALIMFICE